MSRLPDTFIALVEQVAEARGGGAAVVRSRLAAARRDRRRRARLERLYGYALRHPAPERDRVLRESRDRCWSMAPLTSLAAGRVRRIWP